MEQPEVGVEDDEIRVAVDVRMYILKHFVAGESLWTSALVLKIIDLQ